MATSIALALATAAITACGGGSTDSQQATIQDAATGSSASAAVAGEESAASAAEAASSALATTNASAVAATSTDTVTIAAATAQASALTDSVGTVASGTVAVSLPVTPTTTIATPTTIPTTITTASTDTQPQSTTGVQVAMPTTLPTTTATRPAGNTGTGFFVANGKLYDAKGKEFRIRGVNRSHWDSWGTPTGLPLSGANTERIALSYSKPAANNWAIVSNEMLANKIVPMPSNWGGTCKSDLASLNTIVDTWVAQAATWTQLNGNGLINIANEWGPPNSTVWRDAYIAAIARMRAAGYTGTLVVDSGGCGQDPQDILKYGAAVLAADPQNNILFDVHVYGGYSFPAKYTWQNDYTQSMAAMKATGLPIVLGEFGPGKRIGPSPTAITPEQVIATAEANGWGWIPWAWDDNNLANCKADDNWFSMTRNCGVYKTDADLTAFGQVLVPIIKSTAVKASIFN